MLSKNLGLCLFLASLFLGLSWLSLVWTARAAITASNPMPTPQPFISEASQLSSQISHFSPVLTPFVKALDFEQIPKTELQLNSKQNIRPKTLYLYNSYGSGDFFLPPYSSDSDRMGFGKTSYHDATPLNAGWYVDWNASFNPIHPGGAEYARTILFKVHDSGVICGWAPYPATKFSQVTPTLTGTALIQNVQANPGALWLIGNEPDAIFNGSPIQAELYAELYHNLYTIIKNADPTAKVAIGAVVQPSPLRIIYLDRILNHYQATYGELLPTDVWNIHFYILNEESCEWGASEPPFVNGPGWQLNFTPADLLDLVQMENNLRFFRQWMYDRGYKDKPLIITEYGVLPTPELGFSDELAAQFLKDMSTLFLTTTDPTTGYAADGNRLAQMWAWFSTNWPTFGGDLFDSNDQLTVIGNAFIAETGAHYTPYIDLEPIPPITITTSTHFLDLITYIQNRGNIDATSTTVQLTLVNAANGTVATETPLNFEKIQKRYAELPMPIDYTWHITFTEMPTITIPYTLYVTAGSADAKATNNQLSYPVNWWPLTDLAITELVLSSNPFFAFNGPITMVATATVANIGAQVTPQASLTITLELPSGQATPLISAVVLPTQAGDIQIFTATVTITQSGIYTLSAALPTVIGPPEITNNNKNIITIIAAEYAVFLPIIAKPN